MLELSKRLVLKVVAINYIALVKLSGSPGSYVITLHLAVQLNFSKLSIL